MTAGKELAARDVAAIRAHAARVHSRMTQTPYGPKRKLLAAQHVDLTNEALRAEGWNEALALFSSPAAADRLVERIVDSMIGKTAEGYRTGPQITAARQIEAGIRATLAAFQPSEGKAP